MNPHDKFYKVNVFEPEKMTVADYLLAVGFALALLAMLAFFI